MDIKKSTKKNEIKNNHPKSPSQWQNKNAIDIFSCFIFNDNILG